MLDNATYMNIIGIIKLLATEGQLGPGVSKKQSGENINCHSPTTTTTPTTKQP